MNRVFELDLEPKRKMILLVLADHADADGYCFPGQARLARRTSIPERTLRRFLDALEQDGWFVRERRQGSGGERMTDGYRLSAKLAGGPTGQNEGAYRPTVAGSKEPSVEPPTTPPTPSGLEESFDRAWAAWPKKESRKVALSKWDNAAHEYLRAVRKGDVVHPFDSDLGSHNRFNLLAEIVIRFGQGYAAERAVKFTPMLSTWLNQEKWTDPLPGARPAGQSSGHSMLIPAGHKPVWKDGYVVGSEPIS